MPAAARGRAEPAPDTVFVGCKLPNGLVLRLFSKEEYNEAVPGGFRSATRAIPLPEAYVLNGAALPPGALRSGDLPYPIVNGAAITSDVPREFWEKWLHDNRDAPYVKRNMVFAHRNEASLRAMAKELKEQKTGLEPIDPDPEALNRIIRPTHGLRIEKLTARDN